MTFKFNSDEQRIVGEVEFLWSNYVWVGWLEDTTKVCPVRTGSITWQSTKGKLNKTSKYACCLFKFYNVMFFSC